jgi:DNA-binding YbaB/EbfC family protein
MANMFQMMKQAATMQRELKRIQKELSRQSVEFENGGVKVVARGDMTVERVDITADALQGATPEKLGRQVTTAVNGALAAAKKQAGEQMQKLTQGAGLGGLGDMLGG